MIETESVYCAVRTGPLNKIHVSARPWTVDNGGDKCIRTVGTHVHIASVTPSSLVQHHYRQYCENMKSRKRFKPEEMRGKIRGERKASEIIEKGKVKMTTACEGVTKKMTKRWEIWWECEEVIEKVDMKNRNNSHIMELIQCLAIGIAFRRKFCSDTLWLQNKNHLAAISLTTMSTRLWILRRTPNIT